MKKSVANLDGYSNSSLSLPVASEDGVGALLRHLDIGNAEYRVVHVHIGARNNSHIVFAGELFPAKVPDDIRFRNGDQSTLQLYCGTRFNASCFGFP